MAEAYLQHYGGDNFEVESAGLEAGILNPLAIEVMLEDGIDISQNSTNDVFDYFKEGRTYHYVITVCDAGSAARCPIFPGIVKKLHWDFADPSAFGGTHQEKIAQTRKVRDEIKTAVLSFIAEFGQQ